MLAHLPALRDTLMWGEMALGRLECEGLLQEHTTLTAGPSSRLVSQPLEVVADTRDTSKGTEEGFSLSNV